MSYNCRLHEMVMTVWPTYAHNNKYDVVHVESIFETDQPIPENDIFFVPGLNEVPSNILEMLRLGGFTFQPIPKSVVTAKVADFAKNVELGNKEETISDAMLGIATEYMQQVKMTPISGNFYRLSYDFSLLPDPDRSFTIQARLPFEGFDMPNGGQVRFIVILPTGAKCDRDATKGEVEGSHIIIEEPTPPDVANGRQIVSFFYQNDPKFTVKYRY